jgi:hypothetical protein
MSERKDLIPPSPQLEGPWVTLDQAAFIMQEHPETVRSWIDKGLLLANKSTLYSEEGPVMIHQTELDRFRHPWKHIWRLDARIDAQQKLVETLKVKIGGGEDMPTRMKNVEDQVWEISDNSERIDELTRTVQRLTERIIAVEALDDGVNVLSADLASLGGRFEKLEGAVKRLAKKVKDLVAAHKLHRS